jgi:hypothetical protein
VSNNIKLKIIKNPNAIKLANVNFAYVASPKSQPTIVRSASVNLVPYSNTAQMLANDATTYANAVNYVNSQNFVNTSQLSTNLANLTVSSLSDVSVTLPITKDSTLVYNTTNNKYEVKQLDVDGGTF